MKKITLALCLLALVGGGLRAQQTATSNLARESFEDRSAEELRQIRAQVDAAMRATPQAGQSRFAPIYDALERAENALAAYKVAGAMDVQQRLADYQQARSDLVRRWNDFQIQREPERPRNDLTNTPGM